MSLGAGGQGCTFRAVDSHSGDDVAVKVIRLQGTEGWKPFDLFERECQVLQGLDHPGIPSYLDSFSEPDQGKYYLVMSLVEGESLKQMLDRGRSFTDEQLWNFLHQTLEVLEYLHSLRPPVIHRDVKPANLIRGDDGRLTLVDFGGVRVALRPDGGSTVVGTFGYMAPEQLHGDATAATDIFGLGATLAALAAGMEADKIPRKGLKVSLAEVMDPSSLRELLQQMLAPDPDERLATVAAVREAARQQEPQAPRAALEERSTAATQQGEELPVVRGPDDLGPLRGIPGPLIPVFQVLGSLGYLGLVIIDAILLPLVFTMLGSHYSSRPIKLERLEQRKKKIHKVLGGGRRSMKALSRGQNPYGRKPTPPQPPERPEPPRPPNIPLPRKRGRRRLRGGRRRIR